MNNKYAYFPKYHPNRQSYDRWVDKVGQKRYDIPTYDRVGISTAKKVQAVVDVVFNQGMPAISEIRK